MSTTSVAKAGGLRFWNGLRSAGVRALTWVIKHPWWSVLAVLALWVGGMPAWAIATQFAVWLALALAGRDALVKASTLNETLISSYRCSRIRRRWRRTMVNCRLYKTISAAEAAGQPGKQGSYLLTAKLVSVKPVPGGVCVIADGSDVGCPREAFEEEIQKLRSAWRCRDVLVDADPTPRRQLHRRALGLELDESPVRAHCTRLRAVYADPFSLVVLPSDLPLPSQPLHVVLGLDSQGEPLEAGIWLPHLIAGGKGSGKSSMLWRLLRGVDECTINGKPLPWLARIFDPKGGQELGVAAELAYHYESAPNKWGDFVEKCCRALEGRTAALAAIGERDWVNVAGDPRFPLHVVAIDELVSAILQSKAKNERGKSITIQAFGAQMSVLDALMMFMSQCRSAGMTVVAGTQIVQKDVIGLVRDQFDLMTCLRLPSVEMVRIVTGDSKLYPAHQIPATRKTSGVGFTTTDTGWLKFRGAFEDEAARLRVAQGMARWSEQYRKQSASNTDLVKAS